MLAACLSTQILQGGQPCNPDLKRLLRQNSQCQVGTPQLTHLSRKIPPLREFQKRIATQVQTRVCFTGQFVSEIPSAEVGTLQLTHIS